ncbi:MIR domain protein [Oesophagostomum dentatum]|uniref:MIR domain protein n=1 Tax=Oesophagostomum dentatum TaxID=61180 RepID=A0A0B1T903_OESDE|nr:MIR domain protein [Oesophagostomum dentatum]
MYWVTILLFSTCVANVFSFDDEVTCGTVLKLMNVNDGSRLHSHDVKYGSGSGQQSVTAVQASDDVNSHWQIFPGMFSLSWETLKESCKRGDSMKCGSTLRLKHLTTGCFLHTHHFIAPLSKQHQEVSCFGNDAQSDTGDNWQLVCDTEAWMESEPVKFKHVDTGIYLALSGQQYGRPIHGQREVVGTDGLTNSGRWKAAEGVFMKRNKD